MLNLDPFAACLLLPVHCLLLQESLPNTLCEFPSSGLCSAQNKSGQAHWVPTPVSKDQLAEALLQWRTATWKLEAAPQITCYKGYLWEERATEVELGLLLTPSWNKWGMGNKVSAVLPQWTVLLQCPITLSTCYIFVFTLPVETLRAYYTFRRALKGPRYLLRSLD